MALHVLARLLDLPSWEPGNPTYALTYIIVVLLALLILGGALAASLRKGNAASRKKTVS